ncbi:hypothetical protein BHYA_0051g00160 [Botrytis hyacinthi]|uniref:Protein kinase domain-containing protein n=1 Tax=Botrytis hyacinthi TaxID=278943 RepID=A0A4Z1GS46_9HELO|nr:hypothetical protein BHYA_0051g00160 [Botrytis hyacinthi]
MKDNDITLLDTVDEDHEIPGLKSLTVEILGRIHEALDEWKRIGQKYRKVEENQGTIVGAIEGSKLEYGSDCTLMEVEIEHLIDHNDTKAAEIIILRHENKSQIPELLRNDEKNKIPDSEGHTSLSPFAKSSTWAKSGQESMQIPKSDFASFSERKLQYYHANKSLCVPLPRTMAVYAPLSKDDSDIFAQHFVGNSANEQSKQISTISLKADSAQTVLIEWRLTAAETHYSELSPEDLLLRRHHTAHLLHRTFDTDADFRILDCIGYTTTTGHTPEGGSHELYSRPDDERYSSPSEGSQMGIADLDMYVHIARIIHKRSQSHFPRFRSIFDIYSLGIVLLELSFWEPIMTLATPSERVAMTRWEVFAHKPRCNKLGPACSWWKTIWEVAKKELAPEMGDAYRDAVLFCLRGNDHERDIWTGAEANGSKFREIVEKRYPNREFSEVGIEKEFYWKVVKTLEAVRI